MGSEHVNWPYVINLGNSIIGVSILAMPFCFKECGLLLGIVLLLSSAWLTQISCSLLMKGAFTAKRRSYEFLAFFAFGSYGKLVVEISIIGLLLGSCVAFYVIIGDLGPAIISKILVIDNSPALRMILMVFVALFIALPLSLLKNIESLSKISAVSLGFYMVFVAEMFIIALPNLWSGNWFDKVQFWVPGGVFKCLPIFALAFGCQSQLFVMYDALPEPSIKRMNSIAKNAITMCTTVYLLVGYFGYVAFSSVQIQGDILMNFGPTLLSSALKLGFLLSVAVSFPLVIFPCRTSIHSLLFAKTGIHENFGGSPIMKEKHFKYITLGIILFTLAVGIMIPNVEFILALTGSTMGSMISYIIPAAIYINVMSMSKSGGKSTAQIVLFLGVTILLASTYTTVYDRNVEPAVVELKNIDTQIKEIPVERKVENIPIVKENGNDKDHRHEPPNPHAPPDDLPLPIDNKIENIPKVKEEGVVIEKPAEKIEPIIDSVKAVPKVDDKMNVDTLVGNKEKIDAKIVNNQDGNADEAGDKKNELSDKEVNHARGLILELEKQREEQQNLIDQQKEIIQELKNHKEDHINDVKEESLKQQLDEKQLVGKDSNIIEPNPKQDIGQQKESKVIETNINQNIGQQKEINPIETNQGQNIVQQKVVNIVETNQQQNIGLGNNLPVQHALNNGQAAIKKEFDTKEQVLVLKNDDPKNEINAQPVKNIPLDQNRPDINPKLVDAELKDNSKIVAKQNSQLKSANDNVQKQDIAPVNINNNINDVDNAKKAPLVQDINDQIQNPNGAVNVNKKPDSNNQNNENNPNLNIINGAVNANEKSDDNLKIISKDLVEKNKLVKDSVEEKPVIANNVIPQNKPPLEQQYIAKQEIPVVAAQIPKEQKESIPDSNNAKQPQIQAHNANDQIFIPKQPIDKHNELEHNSI